jgi:ADP-ribose pyrophosphatase YjhB (NUDIX family)
VKKKESWRKKEKMKNTIIGLITRLIKQRFVYVGVPVIIQNSKKEILLGKRDMSSRSYPNTWGLPGGMADYGEHVEKTAEREVKEELGVDAKIIRRSSNIYQNIPNKENRFHSVDIPFYAKIINGTPKAKDETSEVKWFKPSEIRGMKLAYSHKELLRGEGLI